MNMNNRQHWDQEDFELEAEFEDVSRAVRARQPQVPMVSGRLDRRIREHAKFQASEEASKSWIFSRAPQLALAASLFFGVSVYFVTSLEYQSRQRPESLSEYGVPAVNVPGKKNRHLSPGVVSTRTLSIEETTFPSSRETASRETVSRKTASASPNASVLYERQVSVSSLPVLEKPVTRKLIAAKDTNLVSGTRDKRQSGALSDKYSGVSWVKLNFMVNDNGEVDQIRVIESCLRNTLRDHCIDDDVHDQYAIDQVMRNTYQHPGEMEEIIFVPVNYKTSRTNLPAEDR